MLVLQRNGRKKDLTNSHLFATHPRSETRRLRRAKFVTAEFEVLMVRKAKQRADPAAGAFRVGLEYAQLPPHF